MAVVEITCFDVRKGSESAFQAALVSVLPILTRQRGHISHRFGPSVERPERFWLIVDWETLEDHIAGFQKSADFQIFVGAFRPLLATPAVVAHFRSPAQGGCD